MNNRSNEQAELAALDAGGICGNGAAQSVVDVISQTDDTSVKRGKKSKKKKPRTLPFEDNEGMHTIGSR